MGKVLEYTLVACCLLLAGCGPRSGKTSGTAVQERRFQAPSVPSVITDQAEADEYFLTHYWDSFLGGSFHCDSTLVNGTPASEVEEALGMFVTLLERGFPLEKGQKVVAAFFDKVERFQAADTASNVFGFFEKMVPKYLYDPNSPVRDEDLYLPYVSCLANSPFVSEDMRPAYLHDVRMCSLNQVGTPAADFTFTDLSGRRCTLHGIKADYTLLFFTNPGCPACKEITEALTGSPRVEKLASSGKLAVVNVYIDLEIDRWKALASEYPSTWHNGYDQDYTIRQEVTYNVRAIPSMYVLDSEKRVVMKDATTEKVITYLENIK